MSGDHSAPGGHGAGAPLANTSGVQLDLLPSASHIMDHFTHGSEGGHGEGHAYDTLYLLFWAVILGTAVLQLATLPKLRALPVTVVFFVLGIACALCAELGLLDVLDMHTAHRSYTSWAGIDPHLLLFTFLPPLLFGDAMTIDMHVARRTIRQCLILAVPGVIIGAFATAAVLRYVLPYGWSWEICIMVGSILAATDPVAVVSLLKDLGASPTLTMLIQGEALLNDGTAMVLFSVAYRMVGGEETSVSWMARYLFTSTVGAVAVGASIGFIGFLWIRSASDKLSHSSSTIQICVTLACAYWSFIFAEGICRVSGVLSTVSAAAVLAAKMWPVLVERQAMQEIWHFIETFSNTLVFFLAGLLTGKGLPEYTAQDFLYAVIVYVAINIIRLGMMLGLRPWLNRSGGKVSFAEVGVISWGGLRGMVGLALAILVKQDRAGGALAEDSSEKVLFLVAGVAALTLFINATTAPRLCELLGVSDTPEGRQVLVKKVARRAQGHVKTPMDKLVASSVRPMRAWAEGPVQDAVERLRRTVHHSDSRRSASSLSRMSSRVSQIAERGLQALREPLPAPDIDALWRNFEHHKKALYRKTGSDALAYRFEDKLKEITSILELQVVCANQLKIVREVFLEAVRASYWTQMHSDRFVASSREPAILLDSVGVAKHETGVGLHDWKILEQDMKVEYTDLGQWSCSRKQNRSLASRVRAFMPMPTSWRKWFEEMEIREHFQQQLRAIHIIGAFVEAHTKAQRQIASYFGENDHVDTAEEAYVILESQTFVFRAVMLLSRIAKPVQKKMQTLSEVHCISQTYRQFILDAHASGVLLAKEAETLLHPLADAMRALDRDRRQMSGRLLTEQLRSSSISSSCSAADATPGFCGAEEEKPERPTPDAAARKVQRAFRRYREYLEQAAQSPMMYNQTSLGRESGPTLLRPAALPVKQGRADHQEGQDPEAQLDLVLDAEALSSANVRHSFV
mmetsp:Transcript_28634/g.72439  ORF Transcript_28634/g.72439 Transcript_28634/m.72439 type:complete len:970 (-) Transcript_28634:251-3160(-)